jgi:hypothetical protein
VYLVELPLGSYDIEVSIAKYETAKKDVTVKGDQTALVPALLTPTVGTITLVGAFDALPDI